MSPVHHIESAPSHPGRVTLTVEPGRVEQGAIARLTASFTDLDGNPADPRQIKVAVRTELGERSFTDLLREDVGRYRLDIDTSDAAGHYLIHVASPHGDPLVAAAGARLIVGS